MIGKVISHYEVLERLGQGGMGTVYLARDTRLGRNVALKFLSGQAGDAGMAESRFMREARAASALNHENICTIYDVGESDEVGVFIAMEYVEGQTLKNLLANRRLPPGEVRSIAKQLARGLGAAHAEGIVHRDIKPANLIITDTGRVKILDFGLAQISDESALTRSGSTLGTIGYMSPEQARSEKVDHRTDMWAFGVVVYEMLTGRHPFEAEYEAALLYAILNQQPTPPDELVEDLPDWTQVVMRALAKDVADRPTSMADVLDCLKGESGFSAGSAHHDDARKPRSKVRLHRVGRRGLLAGVGLLLIAVLAVVWQATREPTLKFDEQDWVLVTTFENHTQEEAFTGAVEEAIRRSLLQSDFVNVVFPARVLDAAKLMKIEMPEQLDRELAVNIATVDGGISAILAGSIRAIGGDFSLSADLLHPVSGRSIRSFEVRSAGLDGFFDAIERLTDTIRESLGESLSEIKDRRQDWTGVRGPVNGNVTTADLVALKLYRDGYNHLITGDVETAASLLERSIQQDSLFAMAHVQTGIAHSRLGDRDTALRHVRRAAELLEEVSEREQYFIRGTLARLEGRYEEAAREFTLLQTRYPNDFWAGPSVILAYSVVGQYDRVHMSVTNTYRSRPQCPGPVCGLLWIKLAYEGDLEGSDQYYRRIRELTDDVNFPEFNVYPALRPWFDGQFDEAEAAFDEILENGNDLSNVAEFVVREARANFELYRGRFGNALRKTDEAAQFAASRGERLLEGRALRQKALIHRELGDGPEFRRLLEQLIDEYPDPHPVSAAGWLAYAAALEGDHESARSYLEIVGAHDAVDRQKQAVGHLVMGAMAESDDSLQIAAEHYGAAVELYPSMNVVIAPTISVIQPAESYRALARVLRGLDHADAAVAVLESMLDQRIQILYHGYGIGPFIWWEAHSELGQFYDEAGRTAEAEEAFRKIMTAWGQADRNLPIIEHARGRLAAPVDS